MVVKKRLQKKIEKEYQKRIGRPLILDFKTQKAREMMGGPKCEPFVTKDEPVKKQRKHREARIDTNGNEVTVDTDEDGSNEALVQSVADSFRVIQVERKSKYPSWTKKAFIGLGIFVIVMGVISAIIFTPQSFKSNPTGESENINTPTGDEAMVNTIVSFIPVLILLAVMGAVMSAVVRF